ncbi:ciliated left-right organizer metallopeptidase-like [Mytilus californianus]|uniref:ciliated left-right organizer metallopeptidase-like n=1 Tax=Mytilus californianus TaxID=6549 RepID=UPI0022469EC8|nr:ciliated left-right organizer metallopeptidase-like [Mytilus californianus]
MDSLLVIIMALVIVQSSKENNHLTGAERSPGIQRQTLSYVVSNVMNRNVTYQPIRIKVVYRDMYFELSVEDRERIIGVVIKAVGKISQLLSVFPVQKPILLKRSGCHKEWTTGPNKGRCKSIKRNYQSELCMDTFRIPDDHLDGLYVWNELNPDPVRVVYTQGAGVNNTDFILYVDSVTTDVCGFNSVNKVLSYAKVCHVDQYDRPISGCINVCPHSIVNNSPEKMYKTLLHELFHTLGFSKTHFPYFKTCQIKDRSLDCHPLGLTIVEEVNGLVRIVTPSVLRETQNHFGCTIETKYGAPLEGKFNNFTSHWDDVLMYGSIMSPNMGMPHVTFIDRITLALFEDSGWYKVDYSSADDYLWGKNMGCVDRSEFCLKYEDYICRNNSVVGCHYLHKDKGYCKQESNLSCRIYQPQPKGQCSIPRVPDFEEEIFGISSWCFVSNLTSNYVEKTSILTGRCYIQKCSMNRDLLVKVHGSDWIDCPYGKLIRIRGYRGYIKCPSSKDIMCPELTDNTTMSVTEFSNVIYYTSTSANMSSTDHNSIPSVSSGTNNNFSINISPSLFIFVYFINQYIVT